MSYELALTPPGPTAGSYGWGLVYEAANGESGWTSLSAPLELPLVSMDVGTTSTSEGKLAFVGLLITRSDVAAVSIDGSPPIPTIPATGLPYELRSLLYEIPGVGAGAFRRGQLRRQITPLAANGTRVEPSPAAGPPPKNPALETRQWERPAAPARGVCNMKADRIPGLVAESGTVVSVLRPLVGVPGRPFITCAATTYKYRADPQLAAYVLLDAEHPRASPAAIDGLGPVEGPGDPFESSFRGGYFVARRVHGAWLVVEGGRDVTQRLSLLAHLRVTVHL
jgi:hypothetical protein